MKKIFTLLVSAFAFTMVMGQPTANIKKTDTAPVVDGKVDDVWATVEPIAIATPQGTETPTTGDSWWKMLWDDNGLYLLTFVDDDVFVPAYKGTKPGDTWMYDKLEIYFDCNWEKIDGKGPSTGGSGHYQVAPTVKEALLDGGATTEPNGVIWAFDAVSDAPHYYAEYFFPFDMLLDQNTSAVDRTEPIGFDVNIMDNDMADFTPSRNRMNWASAGTTGENWSNMDEAGLITLEGATAGTYVESISVSPTNGTITVDKGTLQLTATVLPEDASIKGVKWVIVGGTAAAKITSAGLLSASSNGTVTIKAVATDGSFMESPEITVTVTGQKQIKYSDATWNEKNLIRNWNFDTDKSEWGGWVDTGVAGQADPVVENGVVAMKVGKSADSWRYQFNQQDCGAEANVEYTVKFKTWATGDAPCVLDFESASSIAADAGGDQYSRYGTSTDPESNGSSEWKYTATVIPTWYTFHVVFDKMIETTIQKIQWMNSLSDNTIYLDSVLLVKTEDIEVITKNANQLSNGITRVYPSPVTNSLYVDLTAINSKVAVYNAAGQKLMEKRANGSRVTFDVASLSKGVYFVRLEDGSSRKFVK